MCVAFLTHRTDRREIATVPHYPYRATHEGQATFFDAVESSQLARSLACRRSDPTYLHGPRSLPRLRRQPSCTRNSTMKALHVEGHPAKREALEVQCKRKRAAHGPLNSRSGDMSPGTFVRKLEERSVSVRGCPFSSTMVTEVLELEYT